MAQTSNQMEKILNEEFWSLIIRKNGDYQIGNFSIKTRNLQNDTSSWSTISNSGHLISAIYEDNYRTPKCECTAGQTNFWKENKENFNYIASRIANTLDQINTNCIIGDCQFCFEGKSVYEFPEERLQELAKRFNVKNESQL